MWFWRLNFCNIRTNLFFSEKFSFDTFKDKENDLYKGYHTEPLKKTHQTTNVGKER